MYNLAKQALARKLVAGSGVITSMAVHPSGDHLIVGSEDKRLWCVPGLVWLGGGGPEVLEHAGLGGKGRECCSLVNSSWRL